MDGGRKDGWRVDCAGGGAGGLGDGGFVRSGGGESRENGDTDGEGRGRGWWEGTRGKVGQEKSVVCWMMQARTLWAADVLEPGGLRVGRVRNQGSDVVENETIGQGAVAVVRASLAHADAAMASFRLRGPDVRLRLRRCM